MATPPEDLKITYGGFAAGTGTEDTYTIVDNGYSIQYSRLTANVSFIVLVKGSSNTVLTSNVNSLVDAYRERRNRLTITIKGSTVADFNPSGQINKDALPTIEELFDDHYTLTSRAFQVNVPLDMPPREANGRTEEEVSVSQDPSHIRTVSIRVSYNSVVGSTANALLAADFDTYAATIKSFFAIPSWELVSKPDLSTIPIIDNQVSLHAIYKELVFDQSSSGTDDADLVEFQLSIQVGKNFPGDFIPTTLPGFGESSRVPRRLLDVTISMRTHVVKTVSDLVAKWKDDIRPYIIQKAVDTAGLQLYAITPEPPTYDFVSRTIEATMVLQGAVEGAGQVISADLSISEVNDFGKLLIGAHDRTDYGRYEIQVKAKRLRVVQETRVTVQGATNFISPKPRDVGKGGRWVITNHSRTVEPKTMGDPQVAGESLKIVQVNVVENQEWITDPKKGGSFT